LNSELDSVNTLTHNIKQRKQQNQPKRSYLCTSACS
jgi:hypothetical protein